MKKIVSQHIEIVREVSRMPKGELFQSALFLATIFSGFYFAILIFS